MKYLLAANGTQACRTALSGRIRPHKRPGDDSRPPRIPDAVAVSAPEWAHGACLARAPGSIGRWRLSWPAGRRSPMARAALSPPTARRAASSLACP